HTYVELHDKTNRQTMKDNLDIAQALNLLSQEAKQARLGETQQFGRTILYAETRYDQSAAARLFLEGDEPRTLDQYERAGRKALDLLVQADDPEAYRRLPATDDNLWKQMKDAGAPGFKKLFPGFSELQLGVITADYSVIIWWANAMWKTAEKLV